MAWEGKAWRKSMIYCFISKIYKLSCINITMTRKQNRNTRGDILAISFVIFVLFIFVLSIPKPNTNSKNTTYPNITITREQLVNNCTEVKEMLIRLNVTSPRVICNISEWDEIIEKYKNTSFKK